MCGEESYERDSESKQSLEYDHRSNTPSILRRFADYPCNPGIWGRVVVSFMGLYGEAIDVELQSMAPKTLRAAFGDMSYLSWAYNVGGGS